MILTVTANPSLDRTLFVDALPRGEVIRSRGSRSEPSGKGINVAVALHRNGFDVAAVLPVAGSIGAQLVAMLDEATLKTHRLPVDGETRSNISLVEPDGTVTKINEGGPALGVDDTAALLATVRDNLTGVTWLACCGSLPVGADQHLYARLAGLARKHGVAVAVDSSGPALRASLTGRPDLVKPNVDELAELVGASLRTLGDVVTAAQQVRRMGAGAVLASLGADGAVLVAADVTVHAEAPVRRVVSTVGAGDAALAGFLAGGGDGVPALRTAVAWGAAAVGLESTLLGNVAVGHPVLVHEEVDLDRPLTDVPSPSPRSPPGGIAAGARR